MTTLARWMQQRVRESVDNTYKGVPIAKLPEDLWVYQQIIWETKPEVIVELGTAAGGSAIWFFDQMRVLTENVSPLVVSVDKASRDRPQVYGVEYVHGDLMNGEVIDRVARTTNGRRSMVVEDSEHSHLSTSRSLTLYSPLVTPGCYFVVEDGIVEDDALCPSEWYAPGTVGKAIDEFLRDNTQFEQRHFNNGLTMHPGGWLLRT